MLTYNHELYYTFAKQEKEQAEFCNTLSLNGIWRMTFCNTALLQYHKIQNLRRRFYDVCCIIFCNVL